MGRLVGFVEQGREGSRELFACSHVYVSVSVSGAYLLFPC